LENLEEKDHFEDLGIDGEDSIKMDFRETGCKGLCTGFNWLKMGTSVKLL
jgi:hypothetical protein